MIGTSEVGLNALCIMIRLENCGVECGLYESVLHPLLICLHIWSPIGKILWRWLKKWDLVVVENVCCWEWALRFHEPSPSPVSSVLYACVSGCKLSAPAVAPCLLACCLSAVMIKCSKSLKVRTPKSMLSFIKCLHHYVLTQQ